MDRASEGVAAGVETCSTNLGGAKTTAVLDIVAEDVDDPIDVDAGVTAAPTGSRGAANLAFCTGLRRTGANARLADHPDERQRVMAVQKAWTTTV